MSEEKQVVFRSKYERHQIYMGAKLIRFVKNHYKTTDAKEIDFLRKESEKRGWISEIKPEKKMVAVFVDENETEETALEKALTSKKSKKSDKAEKPEKSDKEDSKK